MRIAGGDRLAALDEKTVGPFMQSARAMGEMPFAAPSPQGWPDVADSWTGSDAVLQRVEWANAAALKLGVQSDPDRKSTRLNSSHQIISYAVFCLKKKKNTTSVSQDHHS